jgi:hypothetical protein
MQDIPAPAAITLHQTEAENRPAPLPPAPRMPDESAQTGIEITVDQNHELTRYAHQGFAYEDFRREELLFHKKSTEGPAACTGDISGNGLADVYLGGARGQAGSLWLQTESGNFEIYTGDAFTQHARSEDIDCIFFDATGSGRDALYVVSGGNSLPSSSSALADRLYFSEVDDDGGKHAITLRASEQLLPGRRFESGAVVRAHDFTGDGHQDLFVGTRLRPFGYGLPVRHYVLQGDGAGGFTDITEEWAPELLETGMLSDAAWADLSGNGRAELILAGEWGPIRVFENSGEALEEITEKYGLGETHGLWNVLEIADMNGDGRPDIIAGNHGRNSKFEATQERPLRMDVGDFAQNGLIQHLISQPDESGTRYVPLALRHELIGAIPRLREAYPDYASYAQTSQEALLAELNVETLRREAKMLESRIFWNREGQAMDAEALPLPAQLAPQYALFAGDLSGSGRTQLLSAGNLMGVKPQTGSFAASRPVLMFYDEADETLKSYQSAALNEIEGEIRRILPIQMSESGRVSQLLLVRYDDAPVVLNVTPTP